MTKNLKILIPSLTMAVVLAVSSVPVPVHATGDLKQKIEQAEQEKKKTEQEKAKAEGERDSKKGELNQLKFEQGTLKAQLDSFNAQLEEANANLLVIQGNIESKNTEIDQAKADLNEAQKTADIQYLNMKKRVQAVYEQPETAYVEMLLSSKNFSDFLNLADYLLSISEYDNKMFEDYKAIVAEVDAKKKALEDELAELEDLEKQNEDEQARINTLIQETTEFVAEYQVQISGASEELANIEAEIAAKEAEIAKQQEDIEALKKKYEEELRLSQAAANAAWRDISQVSFGASDRDYIAAIIYCEAGGESYEGKLAVGAVVINRVLSSKYPDDVYGVITQPYQFSPVLTGRFNQVLSSGKANADCYRAADEAMKGMTNVENCLYFRTPIAGIVPRFSIGNHIFY